MTPGARVQAAIDVLETMAGGVAAEQALSRWARGARYAGSKDRAAVRDHVFDVLRRKKSCAARGGGTSGRALMLGLLRLDGQDLETLFVGGSYAPEPLISEELEAGSDAEVVDLPDWLISLFIASLGDDFARTEAALRTRAPVMLRVNMRLSDVPAAQKMLLNDEIETALVPGVKTALIVAKNQRRIAASVAYKTGVVELQDASSQAAMEQLEIAPGSAVLDYCAGGGGKVLALAARADANWTAHDAQPQRMKDLPPRAERAGAQIFLAATEELEGGFDVVLCDVPCSGSGTWRRTPDAKWRLTPEGLEELLSTQQTILDTASKQVGPSGFLAYATCSVLRCENEDQIATFLKEHPNWEKRSEQRWPVSDIGDGFYISVLEKLF